MYKRKVPITRIKKDEIFQIEDEVLIESAIDVVINSKSIVNIVCLPKNLKELAIGFLFSINLINSIEDIELIKVSELENKIEITLKDDTDFDSNLFSVNPISRVIDTTCGISSPWRNIIKKGIIKLESDNYQGKQVKINSHIINKAIKLMQTKTKLYRETGGCHGAAIFSFDGELLSVMEDIGRHNAIDKVIGDFLIKKRSFNSIMLMSTGRLTGDSVLKAIRAKIPIIASLSAPIESGIRLAFNYGLTLIGFVRGARMNIYTHPERIISE